MIRQPSKDERYMIETKFGPTITKYFLEMIQEINRHMEDTATAYDIGPVADTQLDMPSFSVNPLEASDGGS